MQKKDLQSQYKRAVRRVKRETQVVDRARSRKAYWKKVADNLHDRLKLANEGQLEFNFTNQGEDSNESRANSISYSEARGA